MSNAGRKSRAGEWLTNDGLVLLEGWARDGLKIYIEQVLILECNRN